MNRDEEHESGSGLIDGQCMHAEENKTQKKQLFFVDIYSMMTAVIFFNHTFATVPTGKGQLRLD